MSVTPTNPINPALLASPQLQAIISSGPYRHVIWDFDGVVADSEPLQGRAYEIILARHGATAAPNFFREYIGRTELQIWSALCERYGLTTGADTLRDQRIAVFLERALRELTPNWFVRPLMNWFSLNGAKQFIVSSGNKLVVETLLNTWGLYSLFERIFAADLETAGAYSKIEALRSIVGIAPRETLVLEDHKSYLMDAEAFGAATVAIEHSLNDIPEGLGTFTLKSGASIPSA